MDTPCINIITKEEPVVQEKSTLQLSDVNIITPDPPLEKDNTIEMCSVQITTRDKECLKIANALSELNNNSLRDRALANLGILDIINNLDNVYLSKGEYETDKQIINEALTSLRNSVNSIFHVGEFNANNLSEEGWYDAIILGRPEGSESDEKYFLYMSGNGGQLCWSRRNSGKCYHRLGIGHPWVAVTHDDYSLEHSTSLALSGYTKDRVEYITNFNSLLLYFDLNTELAEIYAGDNLEITTFDVYGRIYLKPNSIIKVRCLYRNGPAWEFMLHKYDSDAYIYVSNSQERGHNIDLLKSDFIKVKSMASVDYLFTEPQLSWQDLALVRDYLFTDSSEYGWHYIKCNVQTEGYYYLHIAGDFSLARSWIAFDNNIEIYYPNKLSQVAISGNYNDLLNKPTNLSQFNNDSNYLTEHQDVSGLAEKSEMSVVDGSGADDDKTTITLKSGTSATVLKKHQDVSAFITKSVNDLVDYYLKSEVYTKQEVAALIGAIQQFHYEIYASTSAVDEPASNVLYLIGPTGTGSDKYEEYVYDSTKQEPWIKIGDTSIDLSGYVTTEGLASVLAAYYQKPNGGYS